MQRGSCSFRVVEMKYRLKRSGYLIVYRAPKKLLATKMDNATKGSETNLKHTPWNPCMLYLPTFG